MNAVMSRAERRASSTACSRGSTPASSSFLMRSSTAGAESPTFSPIAASGCLQFSCSSSRIASRWRRLDGRARSNFIRLHALPHRINTAFGRIASSESVGQTAARYLALFGASDDPWGPSSARRRSGKFVKMPSTRRSSSAPHLRRLVHGVDVDGEARGVRVVDQRRGRERPSRWTASAPTRLARSSHARDARRETSSPIRALRRERRAARRSTGSSNEENRMPAEQPAALERRERLGLEPGIRRARAALELEVEGDPLRRSRRAPRRASARARPPPASSARTSASVASAISPTAEPGELSSW